MERLHRNWWSVDIHDYVLHQKTEFRNKIWKINNLVMYDIYLVVL